MGWFLKHQKTVQNAYHDLRKPEGECLQVAYPVRPKAQNP